MRRNTLLFVLLAFILLTISFVTIALFGNTYKYKVSVSKDVKSVNEMNIQLEQDKDILEIISKELEGNTLVITLKSHEKGKTNITFNDDRNNYLETFYVHNFGIITQNHYLGRSSADIVIPISLLIYIASVLCMLIKKYRISMKKNIYQYKNVAYLGVIIFLIFTFINQILQLLNYRGLINSINSILNSVSFISFILLPIAIIVSIFVVINSIVLLKKEGFSIKNMLGIILGVMIIVVTIMPTVMYNYFQGITIIDIHNERGIALYIYNFIESTIYIFVSYLECVLLGTIILGVKSARYMPQFNKDFVIILGCMIKKDGTLTPLLKSRVDRAIEFANLQKENTNKDIIFVPSGGKGRDEAISEGEAIKNYLVEKGISPKNIIVEDKSTNTNENIKYSYELITKKKKNPNIIFSTTNYHVFRAGIIATEENVKTEGIGSKTKTYFWLNAFIREFIATVVLEKKKHFKVFGIIILITLLMISLIYISNIM
jgi:uncharacterized SAM-binding protein YcdF (DUF218 family)